MEVTARLAEQSAECSVALCQMLGTPLLQQHSSSSPPPHHHHINSIPSPSSPSTVHSQTHQPTWPLVVSLPAAASSARPPAAPVLLNLLPTQLSFSQCLILRTLTHSGGLELEKKKSTLNKSHSLECLLSSPASVAAQMRKRLLHTVGRLIRILSDLRGGPVFNELVMFIPEGM